MSKVVLVAGGLGYVGGRLALSLKKNGYHVKIATRKKGLNSVSWLPGIQIISVDWNSTDGLFNACIGVDSVINLAGVNEIVAGANPLHALSSNGIVVLNLLDAAKRANVRRFIHFSTAHVYGAPLEGSISEKTLPRPLHPYALCHKAVEDFVLSAHSLRQIDCVVFRLSNGFGAPASANIDRWMLLVNNLCFQATSDDKLILNTSGIQLRDFISLGNVARAVIHMLKIHRSFLGDGLFNLGSGTSLSIYQMAEIVASRYNALYGKKIPIVRSSDNVVATSPFHYNCEKLMKTEFIPKEETAQEIDDTLVFCRKNHKKIKMQ